MILIDKQWKLGLFGLGSFLLGVLIGVTFWT